MVSARSAESDKVLVNVNMPEAEMVSARSAESDKVLVTSLMD